MTKQKKSTTTKFKSVDKEKNVWDGEEVSVESDTKLEADIGVGDPIILRFFDFTANPVMFKQHVPTGQELFDSHSKGMATMLWTDGLSVADEVPPRFMISKNKKNYRFIIACRPKAGNVLLETPQTLSELAHGQPHGSKQNSH